jgi:hypothetical protein
LSVERALLVLRVGILDGRLPSRTQQPGKLNLRLPRFSFDELDQKYPFVAVVEEKSHLRSDLREGLDDTRPLDASCPTLALTDINKQLVLDRRIVNVCLQPAVKSESVIEVEIEKRTIACARAYRLLVAAISKSRRILGVSDARKTRVSVSAIRFPFQSARPHGQT